MVLGKSMSRFSTAKGNFKALPTPHKIQKFVARISKYGYFKNLKLGKKGMLRLMIESFYQYGHTNKWLVRNRFALRTAWRYVANYV